MLGSKVDCSDENDRRVGEGVWRACMDCIVEAKTGMASLLHENYCILCMI